jgi:hypothetical protein
VRSSAWSENSFALGRRPIYDIAGAKLSAIVQGVPKAVNQITKIPVKCKIHDKRTGSKSLLLLFFRKEGLCFCPWLASSFFSEASG